MLTGASGGVTLAYDPLLRLYQTAGAATTRMLYDGATLIAEYDGSNALQRRYVHGPGTDEPLVWYEGTGTSDRRFHHADERGSIVATSNGSGAALGYNAYDEYGIPGSGNGGRFQYTGQQWIAELGLYHYRARIYSPTLGRFLQTDPIGYWSGMNLYAYVRNDPVNFIDPSGLGELCWNVDATTGDGHGGVIVQSRRVCYNLPESPGSWGAFVIAFQTPTVTLLPPACAPANFTVTGVGPHQANGPNRTSITQQPGNQINPRAVGVAINPENFGVSDARGARRDVFANIRLYPVWGQASGPSFVPAVPPGLPAAGPYRPIDVIPGSQRQPGNQIDLYRYSDQNQAFASTRSVPMVAVIPPNSQGVTCPH